MASSAHGRILQYLRSRRGVPKRELARLLGWSDPSLLARYEKGAAPLSRESLDAAGERIGYPPEAVEALLFTENLLSLEERPEPPSPVALTREERREVHRNVLAAGWTMADALYGELAQATRQEKAALALAEGEKALVRMRIATPAERRDLAHVFPEYRSWALAVQACAASLRAAADKADEALELADLAGWVAERVGEESESFGRRLRGFCAAHRANALRVLEDFDGADAEFARAWDLWRSGGEDAEPPLLEEWRMFSLESSLRRAQHRFPEALELLDRAWAASRAGLAKRNDRETAGRILLLKANVFQQAGDHERSLAVLEEAAPLIEEVEDRRLVLGHRLNAADSLSRLGRCVEAARFLPEAHELAREQAKELDRLRLLWVDSRVRAGLGERLEATAGLERVREEFARLQLPYEAALSSLDLAVLWLEAGRTAEVRELAVGMAWIFRAQGIAREALAALTLFCRAAEREAATVALARRVMAEVEEARRAAPRPAKGARGRK